MTRISRFARLAILLSAGACLTGVANASIIVDRSALDPAGVGWGLGGDDSQALAVSWSQTAQSDNTQITVSGIQNFGLSSPMVVTFQLLNTLSSSATPIDTSVQTVAGPDPVDFLLWSGMSLGPGTYFITASATGEGAWFDGLTQPGDPAFGGQIGTDYLKTGGAVWDPTKQAYDQSQLAFKVEGTLHSGSGGGGAETPEPATLAMLGAGLTVMGAILRRRRSA